jgi:hypothetical protein
MIKAKGMIERKKKKKNQIIKEEAKQRYKRQ